MVFSFILCIFDGDSAVDNIYTYDTYTQFLIITILTIFIQCNYNAYNIYT